MKKLLLISALLCSFNGWTQTNEKIHQICMDAVDYEGCTKVHKDIRKGNCSIVRETYRKFSSELDTTKIAIENVKKREIHRDEMKASLTSQFLHSIEILTRDMNKLKTIWSFCYLEDLDLYN